MKKIFTLLFILSFGLVFSANISKNENNKLACPTATIMYVGSPFCSNDGIANNVTITGTDAYMGGVYSCMPAGLSISPVTGAITPSLSTPGTYTVTYTIPSVGGCPVVSANTTVTVRGAAQVMFTTTFMNQTVCAFQPIINITAATTNATGASVIGLPPGINYSWAANNVTISGAGTNPGTYNYTITTTGGCSAAVINATITILPYPGASVNSSTVCSGSSATVTATPSTPGTYSYSWTVPAGASNPGNVASFSTSVAGAYSVILNNSGTGCSGTSSSGTVTVTPLPNATVTPASQTICAGSSSSINFTGTPNATISYNINGGPNQSIILNSSGNATLSTGPLTTTTTYNLISATSFCSSPISGSVTITVIPSPTISGSSSVCVGNIIQLSGSGIPAASFPWTSSNTMVATVNSTGLVSAMSAGITTITYTNNAGCAITRSITVNPTPTVTVIASSICSGEIATIVATTGTSGTYSYAWTTPPGTPNPGNVASFTTTTAGTYSVTASNAATGCSSASASGTVWVNPVGGSMNLQCGSYNQPGHSGEIYIDWSNVPGITTYNYSYSINGGPVVTGSQNSPSSIFILTNGQPITFTLSGAGSVCVNSETITCGTLNIDENKINDFVISPNPVTDILNIKNNQTINKVTAFNQLGQMFFEKEYNNNEVQLDFSGLKTGIYFISVNSDKKQSTFKIVKN